MSEIRTGPIVTALLSKGFVQDDSRDHKYFFFCFQDRKTDIFTRLSHGQRTADDWQLGKMARQTRLSKREFMALVECTLSGSDYADLMKEHGEIR